MQTSSEKMFWGSGLSRLWYGGMVVEVGGLSVEQSGKNSELSTRA